MGLDIRVIRAKQRLGPLDGQRLGPIHVHAAPVVALAGVAFRVFVGQHGALSLQHARTGVVFRGDQFDMLFLTAFFGVHRGGQRGVKTLNGQAVVEHGVTSSGPVGVRKVYAGTGF